jgi:hypothetical protein
MTRKLPALALLLLTGIPTFAHRLDEYLQGTILSIEKNKLSAEITLTPGVAIFPRLIAAIDTNNDGVISEAEQHAYEDQVLRDLSLTIDGNSLMPLFKSAEFPPLKEMKEGRGEIHIAFYADLPPGGANRRLTFENHHQSRISVYQVNVLVPNDPDLRIVTQNRNYSQSFYQLDFIREGRPSALPVLTLVAGAQRWLWTIALIVAAWLSLALGVREGGIPHQTKKVTR